jgi:hypothetical protein
MKSTYSCIKLILVVSEDASRTINPPTSKERDLFDDQIIGEHSVHYPAFRTRETLTYMK